MSETDINLESISNVDTQLEVRERMLLEELQDVRAKRTALRGLLEAFGASAPREPAEAATVETTGEQRPAAFPFPPRRSKEAAIKDEVRRLLTTHGRLQRRDILDHCVRAGLLGTELKPINRLANILSSARDEFGSDGRGTFFLRSSSREPESAE